MNDTADITVLAQSKTLVFKQFSKKISRQITPFKMYTETSERQQDSARKNSQSNISKPHILPKFLQIHRKTYIVHAEINTTFRLSFSLQGSLKKLSHIDIKSNQQRLKF